MKSISIIPCIITILVLFSCHKDNSNPNGPNPPTDSTKTSIPTGSMKIALTLQADNTVQNCELIISETGGKKLLDTVAPPGTTIIATLSTNASLADISLIKQHSSPTSFDVVTYKAANPTSWKTVDIPFFIPEVIQPMTTTQAEILFKNVPSIADLIFADVSALNGSFNYFSNSVDISYNYIAGNYILLVFRYIQLYLVHKPKGLHDTVDCSVESYDTAVVANFTRPANYSFETSFLDGLIDTTHTNTAVELYNNILDPSLPDLMYPSKTKFQTYELTASFATAGNKESVSFYSYGKNVNPAFDFPAAGGYLTGTPQNNNCTVAFGPAKPSSYTIYLNNSMLKWWFYVSPDSTTINPLALLTAQSSKLLQGQTLSSLPVTSYYWSSIPGLAYSDYLSLVFGDSTRKANFHVPSMTSYGRNF